MSSASSSSLGASPLPTAASSQPVAAVASSSMSRGVVKEERCPIRWAAPTGVAFVVSMALLRNLRQTGHVTPKQAFPAYCATFAGLGAMAWWLKFH